MNKRILIVADSASLPNLSANQPHDLEFTCATTGAEVLSTIASSPDWAVIVAASQLPDMSGIDLLHKAAERSNATPVLIAPSERLSDTILQANQKSVYRVLPQHSSTEIFTGAVIDAAKQHCLFHRQQRLQDKIRELTLTDKLTGCYTRAYLQSYLTKELNRSQRYSHYLSVLLCDIDSLKEINDTYGHSTGDQVLSGFAETAQKAIRQDLDTVTRWGNDEFLVALPETPIRGAGIVAERIRKQFEGQSFDYNGSTIKGRASIGVAGYAPEDPDRNLNPDDLLRIAERCLSQAKAAGGNTVLCCP